MPDRVYHPQPGDSARLVLEGPEAHHLVRVRRASKGDRVEVFDGQGQAWDGTITECDRHRVVLEIGRLITEDRTPHLLVTLATAVPKGERFDWLIEKATEIGVDRIIPLQTERSVVDPRPKKLDRLRKLIIEACKQSGRNRLLKLSTTMSWSELIDQNPDGPKLIAHPGLGQPIGELAVTTHQVTVAIGPEGGFTEAEVEQATQAGWLGVDLGPSRLRIETAGLFAGSALLAHAWKGESSWNGP